MATYTISYPARLTTAWHNTKPSADEIATVDLCRDHYVLAVRDNPEGTFYVLSNSDWITATPGLKIQAVGAVGY